MLKEQMIISVKKKVKQRWSYRRKIDRFWRNSPKNSNEIGCFSLIVSRRSLPSKFPVKSADFPANLPLKIPRNLTFFSATYQKPWLFLRNTITLLDSVRCSWFCNSFHRYMGELSSTCRGGSRTFLGRGCTTKEWRN